MAPVSSVSRYVWRMWLYSKRSIVSAEGCRTGGVVDQVVRAAVADAVRRCPAVP